MSKPTKEEYFKKKAEEHAREYRTFFEGLSDWEVKFVKKYEGIDGHSGLHAQELLQMVSERVKKAHQKGLNDAKKTWVKRLRNEVKINHKRGYDEAVEEIRKELPWKIHNVSEKEKGWNDYRERMIDILQTLKQNHE